MEIMKSQNEFHLHSRKDSLIPSPGFGSLGEELASLNEHLLPLQESYQEFSIVDLPVFMVDPYDAETHQIKNKFAEQRKNIINVYREGNFLEVTFKHLTANDS
jgi:hypothetical protein